MAVFTGSKKPPGKPIAKEMLMKKSTLTGITTILPFDSHYIKVEKKGKWNLMDADGKLVSDTWFGSISKNSDGSISTETVRRGRAKAVEAKFLDVGSLVNTVKVIGVVPAECVSMLDSGSIVVIHGNPKYVAKATLYGREVFIDKNGGIYDASGTKLRLLFNTVDSERLFKAVRQFNKKLHYESRQLVKSEHGTYKKMIDNKLAMWAFYWVNDEWSIITDHEEMEMENDVRKWTDDFIIRIATDLTPQTVQNTLDKVFGEHKTRTSDGVENWTWNLKKNDLDKLIDTLSAF